MSRVPFPQILLVGVMGVLIGCSGSAPLSDSSRDAAPTHSLIYVIHGDGAYLYHEGGTAKQADEGALAEARLVAAHAPETEVFIFHLRSRQSLLGLFPRPDGTFYHYRDGTLVTRDSYRRAPSEGGLSREATLYREHRHPDVSSRTFLYYGHEIADGDGVGYHASYPNHSFGVDQLASGLDAFEGGTDPFELVVLSTCNNGTPGTVAALAPRTRYLLASPGNLHLSYIDSHPLHRVATAEGGVKDVAVQLAEWAYERLDDRTETAVTLSLYDTEALVPALEDLSASYEQARHQRRGAERGPQAGFVDCRTEMLPELADTTAGVQTWYRAPSFGRKSQKTSHSGWGCPRIEKTVDYVDQY